MTPDPNVTSVQHIVVDCDEDAVNLEQKAILASSSTVPVHEDFEDIHCASSDSLSPDLVRGVVSIESYVVQCK